MKIKTFSRKSILTIRYLALCALIRSLAVLTVGLASGEAIAQGSPSARLSGLNGYSITRLPSGEQLLLGGTNANGRVTNRATLVNFETGAKRALSNVVFSARTSHSATVLTDGTVLIVGGLDQAGEAMGTAELWNPRTNQLEALRSGLSAARAGHDAVLQGDGTVLIRSGKGAGGTPVSTTEVYDPALKGFRTIAGIPEERNANTLPPYLVASLPANGAMNVSTDIQIALRFSKLLQADTVRASTITLTGPTGVVASKVVVAEGGRLVFITPKEALNAGTQYSVLLNAPLDLNGLPLTGSPIRFTTESRSNSTDASAGSSSSNAGAASRNGSGRASAFAATQPNFGLNPGQIDPRNLPPLRAPAGVTALSGQAITLDGQPLANVTIEIEDVEGAETKTDQTGRFLIKGLKAGHFEMWVDARTANRDSKVYGTFVIGVDIVAGKTNVLPYTMWMPEIDTKHAVKISYPTKRKLVIKTPLLPNFELHIPAGTKIVGHDGKPVKEITVTPIPFERMPFPMAPGFRFPKSFTVQPGGAYLYDPAGKPAKARVYYPNFENDPFGTRYLFWHYNPEGEGWYVYGQGGVTKDGKQIVPDPGIGFYEFTGAGATFGGTPPPANTPPPGGCDAGESCGANMPSAGSGCAGDPVDCATGSFIHRMTDLAISDVMPISIKRSYLHGDTAIRPLGYGMTLEYDMYLWGAAGAFNFQYVVLVLPNGGQVYYYRTSGGASASWADGEYLHSATPTRYFGSRIKWVGTGWDLTLKDGSVWSFDRHSGYPVAVRDANGNTVILTRDVYNKLTRITSPFGRWIDVSYDAQNRVSQLQDHSGRVVVYTYNPAGELWKVTAPDLGVTEYTYDSAHRIKTIKDPQGNLFVQNDYDANGRVQKQTYADTGTNLFAYTLDAAGKVTQTNITDERNFVRRMTFNGDGYALTETFALGTPEEQTFTYEREASTNLLLSVTDPLARKTKFTYDLQGNVLSATRLFGTANAVTTTVTYDSVFNKLTSVKDGLNHTTVLGYDAKGNLTSATDPLGHQWLLTYTPAGQIATIKNPLSLQTTLTYDGSDVVSVKDPLNRIATAGTDALGRTVRVSDPLNNTTIFEYDAVDRLVKMTDQHGKLVQFSYDKNGNLLSHSDQNNKTTLYTYDSLNRLKTRKDPLLKLETYDYDLAGNLVKSTDRKGQVSGMSYDSLGRPTSIGYGATVANPTAYQNTTAYTYDIGNRLRSIVDSISGTISLDYDNLDRLTLETTPQGSVGYTYDAADRRATMTVSGQAAITYTFDDVNRLTGITQGTAQATFGYDNANRRTILTLPNTVSINYGYDNADQVTGVTFKKGTATLGTLIYGYDTAGRRTSITGTSARVNLPAAQSGNVYNDFNQLIQRGAATLSYDDNGNLLTDGTNTYTWNSRDQLIAIAGPVVATFQYDAMGRRQIKTIAGTTTKFLYDGMNIVQELNAANTPYTNTLTGLGIDEILTRNDSAGTMNFLTDALGSTVALTDSTGAVKTSYTYEPYGRSTFTGTANSNPFLYTGRELDGTGLYYYRARYYHPTLQRFIAEDPIGLARGTNSYQYVEGNPVSLTDPTGECPWCVAAGIGALTDLATQLYFNGFNLKCVNWKEVAISGAAAGLGVGIAQKLGKISTAFGGPRRPTYRFFQSKGKVRVESHPISKNASNWNSYPHWHPDFAGKPWSKMHWPLVEPIVGVPAALYNATKDDCECNN